MPCAPPSVKPIDNKNNQHEEAQIIKANEIDITKARSFSWQTRH